jgi:hypothetical protein
MDSNGNYLKKVKEKESEPDINAHNFFIMKATETTND